MDTIRSVDSSESSRILVADETAGGRALLREILKADGHAVIEAENEHQLFQYTYSFDPHLVILDLQMQTLDPYAVVGPLRRMKLPAQLPTIALSPAATQTFPQRIIEAGFSAYLVKPVSPFELRSCVSVLLATKKAD